MATETWLHDGTGWRNLATGDHLAPPVSGFGTAPFGTAPFGG